VTYMMLMGGEIGKMVCQRVKELREAAKKSCILLYRIRFLKRNITRLIDCEQKTINQKQKSLD